MQHNLIEKIEHIVLKPFEEKDNEIIRNLRNFKENRHFFFNKNKISRLEQKIWYKNYLEKEDDLMFSVYYENIPNIVIGFVSLYNIDFKEKTCEFGRLIIDKKIPNRIGKEGYLATKAVCILAKNKLKLNKIYLEVFSHNISAIKIYEKIGFISKYEYIVDNFKVIHMEYTL